MFSQRRLIAGEEKRDLEYCDDAVLLNIQMDGYTKISKIKVFFDAKSVYGLQLFYSSISGGGELTSGPHLGLEGWQSRDRAVSLSPGEFVFEFGGVFKKEKIEYIYFMTTAERTHEFGTKATPTFKWSAGLGTHLTLAKIGTKTHLSFLELRELPIPGGSQAGLNQAPPLAPPMAPPMAPPPSQPAGFVPQQPQQISYPPPPQPINYPPTAQPTGYPPGFQQQNYAPQPPAGFPQQPTGYPQQPVGYPQPAGYPAQPQGYAPHPAGYQPQPGMGYPASQNVAQYPPYQNQPIPQAPLTGAQLPFNPGFPQAAQGPLPSPFDLLPTDKEHQRSIKVGNGVPGETFFDEYFEFMKRIDYPVELGAITVLYDQQAVVGLEVTFRTRTTPIATLKHHNLSLIHI
eukprot:TRINITY_DN2582_c0_g1_i4.p1 TRINITY_DN2582_c0_g1~~TRINITY_DN2582_c0_g1_i4.p1  ORF type:complete len:400 (-),score=72.73 TRINITY_DN2582_c0_g1_i4:61-1260(-)